jgi:hypothetical protein
MGEDYYRYTVGSSEHFAAYARRLNSPGCICFPFPYDVEASYEVDFVVNSRMSAGMTSGTSPCTRSMPRKVPGGGATGGSPGCGIPSRRSLDLAGRRRWRKVHIEEDTASWTSTPNPSRSATVSAPRIRPLE